MPTTQVYTWEQFVTAYKSHQGTAADPHVIEIMADIDAASSITATIDAGTNYYKQINGNYNNISNIATATTFAGPIFTGYHITWSKCNFVNIYRNNTWPIFYGSFDHAPVFKDCVIQGQGAGLCGPGDLTSNTSPADYYRCVITWRQVGTSYAGSFIGGSLINYCYIDVDLSTNNVSNHDFGSVYSSYITGRLTGPASKSTPLCNNCSDSVINLESTINCKIASQAANVTVYNKDKMTGNITTTTNVIGVTDTELKDAAYLASIGFNIIV